jgi:hypothetical protein
MRFTKSFVGKASATEAPGTVNGADFDGHNFNGLPITVVVSVTALAAGATVTVTLQGKDPLLGSYSTLAATAAIAAAPSFTLILRNTLGDPLIGCFPQYRISATVAVDNATYSVNVHCGMED